MFDAIAHRYDFLNHLISFGADRRWRALAAAAAGSDRIERFLDVATGTGDLAFALMHRWPSSRVVGVDPSAKMLALAAQKAKQRGAADRLELLAGDAQALEFGDGIFDGVTIAFGIRNVPDRQAALREMARVSRPGGRIVVLELGEPPARFWTWPARFYIRHVLPAIGALCSKGTAYNYLRTSMAAFPPPREFAAMMERAGVEIVEVRSLMFGAATLFVGKRR
jgi:demethylmenaquinone methyltransferase/2-methoxy-6-polyprenyl-1,4-benzoquinol methylase